MCVIECVFLDTDECLSDPCKNNATCRNSHGNFTCNCLTGFEGQTCQNGIYCIP